MERADVHLMRLISTTPGYAVVRSASAGPDGRFRLDIPDTGAFFLRFTGVGHDNYQIPFLIQRPVTFGVDVRLGYLRYAEDLRSVKVIGDFNDFNYRVGAVTMLRRGDGTLDATVNCTGDSLTYQLAGISNGLFSGTQHGKRVFDGKRGYASVIPCESGTATVVLDPALLPRGDTATSRRFADSTGSPARAVRVIEAMEQRRANYGRRSRAKADPASLHRTLATQMSELAPEIVREGDPTLRAMLVMAWLDLRDLARFDGSDSSTQQSIELARRSLRELPPSSPLWLYIPNINSVPFQPMTLVAQALRDASPGAPGRPTLDPALTPQFSEYLDNVLAHNPDRFLRVAFLYGATRAAFRAKLPVQVGDYYRRLATGYPDAWLTPIAKAMFSPERNIVRGKIIGDFSLVSVDDSTVRYTKSGLAGKVYLLDFWATWCGPCVGEIPNIAAMYERFHARGFEVVSVSFDDRAQLIQEFRHTRLAMPWYNVWAGPNFQGPIAEQFDVGYLPRPVLVDANGVIVGIDADARSDSLKAALTRLLGPASTPHRQ